MVRNSVDLTEYRPRDGEEWDRAYEEFLAFK